MSLDVQLAEGIAELGLSVPSRAQRRVLEYLALLEKWNRTYNLTAVRAREDMLTRHVMDSLAILPHVRGKFWIDVGSGAGLPGIPLALASGELDMTLIESNQKKAAFLRQVVVELELRNVVVQCDRVESWQASLRFDVVVARALSDLPRFVALAGRLCAASGMLAAMKGAYPHEELARVPAPYRVTKVIPLVVPRLGAERHLVLIRPG
jgi:16S rRNA (guanine527-N7)-methyltransferase